jgi:hypothetical protein
VKIVETDRSKFKMNPNHGPEDYSRHLPQSFSRIVDPERELYSIRAAQHDVLGNSDGVDSLPKEYEARRMALESAVAPMLPSPITPFQRSDRKKAQTSAMYYSECFLKGVTPTDADNAASDIQGRYNKWWVDAGFRQGEQCDSTQAQPLEKQKGATRFNMTSANGTSEVSKPAKRSHHASGQPPRAAGKKRRKRRGGIRDYIQDHTVNPHDAHSISSVTIDGENYSLKSSSDIFSIRSFPNLSDMKRQDIESIRDQFVKELKANGGDTDSPGIQSQLAILTSFYLSSDNDARAVHGNVSAFDLDGTWLTLTKPTYPESKGTNDIGQHVYALGRMSFDMFRPTGLICSIQGTFNTIHAIDPVSEQLPVFIPRSLRREVMRSVSDDQVDSLRTYNIVVAFTIEPNQTRTGTNSLHAKQSDYVIRRPIRGIMTNYGYILPDPEVPNRLSIWFTGGTLEVNDEENDLEEWKRIFDDSTVPKRDMREFARLLAAKVLLGADASDEVAPDGSMSYTLKRPIGGHGSAFCDVLYLDDSLRIMRGHAGSLYIFSKVIAPDDGHSE